jgi:hypothetical protein
MLSFNVLKDNLNDENRAYNVLIEYAELTRDAKAFINIGIFTLIKGI